MSEIIGDMSFAMYEMGEGLKAPLKNIIFPLLSEMKKGLKTLLGNYDIFLKIIELYKDNKLHALVYQIISLAIIIVSYFILRAEGSFILRPMHLNVAICVFLLLNSFWVIDELDIEFGDLQYLGVFMTPIIWIVFSSTLVFEIIRMSISFTDWMILIIVLLTIGVSLSFFFGFVLAGILFIYDSPVRFLRPRDMVKIKG
jgi:hypothetical protein